jgi:hypothetical protein
MKKTTTHDADRLRGKAKVLYIGGCGRSGSTLLDRMLGQVPGVCSVGELTHLWKALLDDQECGCGEPIRACSFWESVGERAFGGWDAVGLADAVRLQRTVARQRYAPLLAAPGVWPPHRRRVDAYASLLGRLYRSIHEVSGATLVVDSTKHYANALLLRRVPGVDLHAIHLVRDSRGVAFSWTKRVEKPEAVHRGKYMNRYSPGRSARRWLGYNGAFEGISRLGLPTTRVRYEDVVQSPRTELERILRRSGFSAGADLSFVQGCRVDLASNHTVAGNPMRFRVGQIRLQVDEEWRTKLPSGDRALVSLMTWPLLRRYGYAGETLRGSICVGGPTPAEG